LKLVEAFLISLGEIYSLINGGLVLYDKIFFNQQFISNNPAKTARLRGFLKSLIDILEHGVRVHSKLCPPELEAIQLQLEAIYNDLKDAFTKTSFY